MTWIQRSILCASIAWLAISPVTLAQSQRAVSLYSVWVQLSLRGYPQEEIESLLRNMDEAAIKQVKIRLRRTVISNLALKKVGSLYQTSRDKDDLNVVRTTIATELRFSGLQNDDEIKMMIKDRFGIIVDQF